MDIFRNHKLTLPVILASLVLPLGVNASAAYGYEYNANDAYHYAIAHGQSFTVPANAVMPTITRDMVTVTAAPEKTFNGKPIGHVNGDIVATAKEYIGTPYVAYSADPNVGFDCSGFVMYVFGRLGMNLPHSADAQGQLGTRIPMSEAQPGDLLVWEGQHVAIYVAPGLMIDSAKPGTNIRIHEIWGNPYVSRLG